MYTVSLITNNWLTIYQIWKYYPIINWLIFTVIKICKIIKYISRSNEWCIIDHPKTEQPQAEELP